MNLKQSCICSDDPKTRNIPQRILIGALGLASAAIVMKSHYKQAVAIWKH